MHRPLTGDRPALTLLLILTKAAESTQQCILIDGSVSPSAAPCFEEAGGREGRGPAQQQQCLIRRRSKYDEMFPVG